MVICGTVTLTTTGQSLATLLAALLSNTKVLPTNKRVSNLKIQWISGTSVFVMDAPATPAVGNEGYLLNTTNRLFELESHTGANQISLTDIFLGGAAGSETVAIFCDTN